MIRAGVLTLSDKGAAGQRPDGSGPLVIDILKSQAIETQLYEIIPDDFSEITACLQDWSDNKGLNLIITTGGTGVSPRDVTPEATMAVIDKRIPGMEEVMRTESLKKTPHAMLSRSVAGIRKSTLIINLPGSPDGAGTSLDAVMPAIRHAVGKICGDMSECSQADIKKELLK